MRKADAVSLLGGFLGGIALGLGIKGNLLLAIRLLFIAYLLDVVDGIVAKYDKPAPEGFMLDRSIDRFTQVIVPGTLLLNYIEKYYFYYLIYVSTLITIALYRLAYRRVTSLEYFSGLPLFIHSIVILLCIASKRTPNIILLYILLILTIIPIKYYRRPINSNHSHGYRLSRGLLVFFFALIPYNSPVTYWTCIITIFIIIIYIIIGSIVIMSKLEK